jgi:VWFA-related protein
MQRAAERLERSRMMPKARVCVAWTLVLSMIGSAASADIPTFSSEVELITVDVVVVDDSGRPVSDLTKDDFVVEEGGKSQPIASFEPFKLDGDELVEPPTTPPAVATNEQPRGSTGRSFALVIDDVGLSPRDVFEAQRGVSTLIEKGLRSGDEVLLATTSGDTWWTARLPEGRADLDAVVGRLKGRYTEPASVSDYISDYEAYQIATVEDHNPNHVTMRVIDRWHRNGVCSYNPTGGYDPACTPMLQHRAQAVDQIRMNRTHSTIRALRRTMEALIPVRGRKSLLFISPGIIDDSRTPLREITALSREANTAIYFIDARGLLASSGMPSVSDRGPAPDPNSVGPTGFQTAVLGSGGSQDLANDTGGFTVRNTNDFGLAAARIAQQSRVFYMLGFNAPEGKKPGDWRKLKVAVKRKGLKVHARRGYMVRKQAPMPVQKKDAPEMSPEVARTLDGAHQAAGVPLRAMAYVLEPRSEGTTRVLVAAEIDARQLSFSGPDDLRVARAELSVMTTHRDTGQALQAVQRVEVKAAKDRPAGWRAMVQEFDLPAGVAQVRVVARDMATSAIGAVSHRFEIPKPVGLRVSTPIVTDQLATSESQKPAPALAVHRVFRPEGLLYCQFEVFGAVPDPREQKPRVAMGLEVRTPQGRVVRQGAPTRVVPDANGRLVRLVGVGLDGVGEGTYDLVLQVKDEVTGDTLERRETFQLSRSETSS